MTVAITSIKVIPLSGNKSKVVVQGTGATKITCTPIRGGKELPSKTATYGVPPNWTCEFEFDSTELPQSIRANAEKGEQDQKPVPYP